MTIEQLRAQLRAGTITQAQFRQRVAQLSGVRLGLAPLDVQITFTPTIETDTAKRTITGTAALFGVETSDGRILEPGVFTSIREPLSRVKLLVDHDAKQPVGYATALDITDERAVATFHVPETPEGDWALQQAQAGLRDGLSIGAAVRPGGYFWDDNDVVHYTDAELYETSLVAIPAFSDAQVDAVSASRHTRSRKDTPVNREQLKAALDAGTITQAQYDAALAALDAVEGGGSAAADTPPAPVQASLATPPAPGAPVPAEYSAGPTGDPAPRGRVEDRPASFATIAAQVSDLAKQSDMRGIVTTVNAALAENGVAVDAGHAFIGRPEWIGEVWNAKTSGRPYIDSLGGVKPLNGTKLEGFRWARPDEYTDVDGDVEGRVKEYAGNFAEVPTGKRKTVKVEADSGRWGFGTKVDRIFTDLGSPDLVASLFGLLAADFDVDSDKKVRAALLDAATTPAVQPASLMGGLQALALDLKRIGATLTKAWVAEDVFTQYAELKLADIPAWLLNSLGIDMLGGKVDVASALGLEIDFDLAAGSLVGYDKRAVEVRQSPQIRLEAIDIAHGAVDLGFFAYGGQLITDERAIRKYTITAPVEAPTGE